MILGVNCTELLILSADDRARVVKAIAKFGFRHLRIEVPWKLVQPAKTKWEWAALRHAQDLALEAGLELLPVLGVHMPGWKYTAADYGEFVRRTAIELHTPAYEIMNEPNLAVFNPGVKASAIVPLIREAAIAIKSTDPDARVVFPGLAAAITSPRWQFWARNVSPESFLTDALNQGAGGSFDVMAYHPYSIDGGFKPEWPTASQEMLTRVPLLATMLSNRGHGMPLWATEWGYNQSKGITAEDAARRFAAQHAILAASCERSYLFAWRDYSGHGGRFGLHDANNAARQPYCDAVRKVLT